ncbi:GNAT family N-acetyltransferase [Natranaeroarchaeum aerophilus]|uniref:GNAT family N-acetyltransferase n=1 Tax=Natranaeroarchaeum aerophilus TaxID=2917711 RepID=A0AAE3FN86_9EURY|nr:GNAT family N-acetyltransferase [Natranaeroarchaeum aerophilus]MCL9812085.1 GNAT family N-acetyltransferase [Natranaeroarchaeum aerophilus]
MSGLQCRPFEPQDATAVRRVDELALAETETDPDDIPGSGDLADVAASYLDRGGEFLVGVLPEPLDSEDSAAITTHDGSVVAIGGYLPSEAGYEDERTVPGAAELHRMRVHPAAQGRGYAHDLLTALESRITTAGFDPILATTARRQQKAIAFYPSAGYEQVGESTMGEYELVHFEKRMR